MSKFAGSSKIWEKLEESDWRLFANFVKSATRSGLVIINMTKNCENSPVTLKIVRLAIFRNFVRSATQSGLVIINMTKNCAKWQVTQKIVRLAIFPNFCKFCYNGQLALGFSDY